MSDLTAKQQRFVDEYLLDLNATQAAIRAGYSAKTANQQGPRLLEDVEVRAAIDAAKSERAEETKIDAAWVLTRLAEEAAADIADLYDDSGNLRPVGEWPMVWRRGLVQGIEVEELFEGRGDGRERTGVVRKVRLSDRVRRVELIGKHVGVNAFQDQVKFEGLTGLAERVDRAKARALAACDEQRSTRATDEQDVALRDRIQRARTSGSERTQPPPVPSPPQPRPQAHQYRPITPQPEPMRFSGTMDPDYLPFSSED